MRGVLILLAQRDRESPLEEFRARLYKVVDEMCQRVFPDDAGEEDDKKIAECEALGKTYAKRAIEYVKTHEEETDEFVCEKLNLCADDDATRFRCFEKDGSARARNVCLRPQILRVFLVSSFFCFLLLVFFFLRLSSNLALRVLRIRRL